MMSVVNFRGCPSAGMVRTRFDLGKMGCQKIDGTSLLMHHQLSAKASQHSGAPLEAEVEDPHGDEEKLRPNFAAGLWEVLSV